MEKNHLLLIAGAAFVLAVGLIVLLLVTGVLVVGFMGWFPGISSGVTEQQSKQYWAGLASPFAINDVTARAGSIELTVKNQAADSLELESITFDSEEMGVTKTVFGSRESKVLKGQTPEYCASGNTFSYDVVFTFNNLDSNVTGLNQVGEKPLVGKCS
jgi:hypothetical protein